MNSYDVIDIKGKVVKTFPSKNQAEKFKKELTRAGKLGHKVVRK